MKTIVLPETAELLDFVALQDGPHLAELPAPVMRDMYRQMGKAFDCPPDGSVRTVDFQGTRCQLRAYVSGEVQAGPVVVYMHGGGWVVGDLDTHDALCGLLASVLRLRVVAVNYRLAPEHRFPRAHEDCLAETAFIAGSPVKLEAPVTGVAVAGDSAGGTLAFHVATKLGAAKVLGQLLMYPLVDCTYSSGASYEQFKEGYLLDHRLLNRFISDYLPDKIKVGREEVSPLLHPVALDLPPAVVLTAGLDPLRDQGRDLARLLIASGVETHYLEANGLIHGMATMRHSLPTANRIITRAITVFGQVIATAQGARKEIDT